MLINSFDDLFWNGDNSNGMSMWKFMFFPNGVKEKSKNCLRIQQGAFYEFYLSQKQKYKYKFAISIGT